MQVQSENFDKLTKAALQDKNLQAALQKLQTGFVAARARAVEELPEFQDLRECAKKLKNQTLENLDFYLEYYAEQVEKSGGKVHWARTDAEAKQIVLDICKENNAKVVTKGKSMLTEEISLNDFLSEHGYDITETDLGEYILQIRGEHPSHIVAPAIHLTKEQIAADFKKIHTGLNPERDLKAAQSLLDEARQILREKYFQADVGITGANFLIAESGSSVIVTNEGNGDLTQLLAKTHIVMAGIDKVVPSFADASTLLRLLGRSATGQEMTSYVTMSTGARQKNDLDGPKQYHVVLVDNGRSAMLGTQFQPMLRCIRCAACMNHCPVYNAVGGKTYGWVYPGPMGAVLTPSLVGLEKTKKLPNASTFCGKCAEVCPVKIPLPDLMRFYRDEEFTRHLQPARARWALKIWAYVAKHPKLYRFLTQFAIKWLSNKNHVKEFIRDVPLASAWTKYRNFPRPNGKTFMQQYEELQSMESNS